MRALTDHSRPLMYDEPGPMPLTPHTLWIVACIDCEGVGSAACVKKCPHDSYEWTSDRAYCEQVVAARRDAKATKRGAR